MEALARRGGHQFAGWEHDPLRTGLSDWGAEAAGSAPVAQPMLSSESHSNQEDLTSLPGDELEDSRKRLHAELLLDGGAGAGQASSAPARAPKRQTSAGRRAARQQRSPREQRSDDSGEDSREMPKGRGRGGGGYAEQAKPDPVTAAKNKASRERQRRERLNDSFGELTKTLDPVKYVRAEKTTIIAETIKLISAMRDETEQLREDKRAMKERLAQVEKEKDNLLFQQGLLQQELEAYRSQAHGLPPPMGRIGPSVAVGVPVNQQEGRSGGLSRMLQRDDSLPRRDSGLVIASLPASQPPSLGSSHTHPAVSLAAAASGLGHPAGDAMPDVPMSEAFLSLSPPNLQDLDISLPGSLQLLPGNSPGDKSLVSWLTQSDF